MPFDYESNGSKYAEDAPHVIETVSLRASPTELGDFEAALQGARTV